MATFTPNLWGFKKRQTFNPYLLRIPRSMGESMWLTYVATVLDIEYCCITVRSRRPHGRGDSMWLYNACLHGFPNSRGRSIWLI